MRGHARELPERLQEVKAGRPQARQCFERSRRRRWRTTADRLHSATAPRRSPIVPMTYLSLMMMTWTRLSYIFDEDPAARVGRRGS